MGEFASPRANLYENEDGYSVEIIGRASFPEVTMRYREGARTVDVFSEAMAEGASKDFMLDPTTTKRWSGQRRWSRPIDRAKREQILQRIEAALKFAGFKAGRYSW